MGLVPTIGQGLCMLYQTPVPQREADSGMQVPPLPKAVSPHAAKLYKSLARPYNALAEAFKAGDYNALKAEAEVGQSVWQMVSDHLFLSLP